MLNKLTSGLVADKMRKGGIDPKNRNFYSRKWTNVKNIWGDSTILVVSPIQFHLIPKLKKKKSLTAEKSV